MSPRYAPQENEDDEWVHVGSSNAGQKNMAVYLHMHTGEMIEMQGTQEGQADEGDQDNFEFDMYHDFAPRCFALNNPQFQFRL